jgi:hypothetical protein
MVAMDGVRWSRKALVLAALSLPACGDDLAAAGESTAAETSTLPPDSDGASSGDAASTGASTGSTTIGADATTDFDDGPKLDVHGVATESGDDTTTGPVDECECVGVDDGIYMLDGVYPESVWFYDPIENEVSMVGALGCEHGTFAHPNSMAVDRQGNAWIEYYDQGMMGVPYSGKLYRAPLDDLASCEYVGDIGVSEWYVVGMGYAVDVPGGNCDTLYLYNSDKYLDAPDYEGESTLARWDHDAVARVELGPAEAPAAELTGTGEGRLYAFTTFDAGAHAIVELDKDDGSTISTIPLDDVEFVSGAYAFAAWGGDFYLFYQDGIPGTRIARLAGDGTGGLEVMIEDTGLHIVGAGVSTCASYVPPAR